MTSEFGKGLTYCLGLFLAHKEMYSSFKHSAEEISKKTGSDWGVKNCPHLWFSGASDHLYELDINKKLPEKLRKRLKRLQKKVIEWGHGMDWECAKDKDVTWSINEAKELLIEIDKFFGIITEKAEFS